MQVFAVIKVALVNFFLLSSRVLCDDELDGVDEAPAADRTIKPCGPQMLTGPEECCRAPRLVEAESLRSCIGGFGGGMGGGLTPKVLKSLGKEKAQVQENQGGEGAMLAMEKGPLCTAECILRRQGFMNENDDIDFEMMSEKLLKDSGDWKNIVERAISNCSEELLAKRAILPAVEGNCKVEATVVMTCLRRFLTLECLETAIVRKNDGSCEKKRMFLTSCDPFALTKEAIEGKFPEFVRQHLGNMMGLSKSKPGQKKWRYGLTGRSQGAWNHVADRKISPTRIMG
ncbi:Hypothetical predicted protein [Cloeon dipterum]|uniref:Uncharacterized protein n=2 Tax=Cloeon dipterum TaxID=197152 RepID=A0A8S1D7I7_9INSE|nr:Hypothetical predicted protein [Cloeon dipterum]